MKVSNNNIQFKMVKLENYLVLQFLNISDEFWGRVGSGHCNILNDDYDNKWVITILKQDRLKFSFSRNLKNRYFSLYLPSDIKHNDVRNVIKIRFKDNYERDGLYYSLIECVKSLNKK